MTSVSTDLHSACARYRIARDEYFSGSVSDRTEDLRRSWISAAVQVAELSSAPLPASSSRSAFRSIGDGDGPLACLRDILGVLSVLALVGSLGGWLLPMLLP